jgi:alkylhydroperoxidase family enzyme
MPCFEEVRPHFNNEELVNLTLVVGAINAWNRLGVSFRMAPGAYNPPMKAK